MKHILVGFDGSTNAHRALEEALDVARADTRITVVAAAQVPAPGGEVIPVSAEGLGERNASSSTRDDSWPSGGGTPRLWSCPGRPPTCSSRKRTGEEQTSLW
jgi:hypothetical protein